MVGIAASGVSASGGAIPRVPYSELSFSRFYSEFRHPDRPLIITKVPPEQSPCFGALGGIALQASNDSRPTFDPLVRALQRHCRGLMQIVFAEGTAVAEVVEFEAFLRMWESSSFKRRFERAGPIHSATRGSIRTHCRDLWEDVRFPAYFTGEMRLNAAAAQVLYTEDGAYPNLNFAQKGIRKGVRENTPKTELWSAVCRGTQRYTVTPLSAALEFLGSHSILDGTNILDLASRLHSEYLQGGGVIGSGPSVWEGIVRTGDLVYLPAGAIHNVETLVASITVDNHFIDAGALVPTSSINRALLQGHPLHHNLVQWLLDTSRHVTVRDARGVITSADAVPRGFPRWGELERAAASSVVASPLADQMLWSSGECFEGRSVLPYELNGIIVEDLVEVTPGPPRLMRSGTDGRPIWDVLRKCQAEWVARAVPVSLRHVQRIGVEKSVILHYFKHDAPKVNKSYGVQRRLSPLFAGVILDVGAHIGDQSVKWALQFPRARIIALEPNPLTFRYLVWNIEAAGVRDRVWPLCAGLADDSSKLVSVTPCRYMWGAYCHSRTAYLVDSSVAAAAWATGVVPPMAMYRPIEVPTVTLAQLFDGFELERVDLLKIDCEGCEWSVFASASWAQLRSLVGEVVGQLHWPEGQEQMRSQAALCPRERGASRHADFSDAYELEQFLCSLRQSDWLLTSGDTA